MNTKTILLGLFLITSLTIFSQRWIQPKAHWDYTYRFAPSSKQAFNEPVDLVGDTIVLGKLCQHLVHHHSAMTYFPNDYFTYSNSDTIFYLVNNHFVIGFRLNMSAGEMLPLERETFDTIGCQMQKAYYNMLLDSIRTVTVSGTSLRAFSLHNIDSGYVNKKFPLTFIEKIGFTSLPYPIINPCIFDGEGYTFCNYQDSLLNMNLGAHCRSVGINELNTKSISISPNPAFSKINFELSGEKTISIYDLLGTICLQSKTEDQFLDISKLEKGIYFLKIIDKQKNVYQQRFVKE